MGEKIKKLLLMTLFIFLLPVVIAQDVERFSQTIFYKGDVNFILNPSYKAGEYLITDITVTNLENFPIVDGYLVVELIQGCKTPVYPTQFSDCDNILYETKIERINLNSGEEKIIPFSYKLPSNLKSGSYRMDVYFQTKRTPVVGLVESFYLPAYQSFEITGGNYPEVKFLRSKTHVAGGFSQSGPGVYGGANVPGLIYLSNPTDSKFEGNLFVGVCYWDDTSCDSYVLNKSYPVNIETNEEKSVQIEFTSPNKPGAYAIRLELKDLSGKMVSLYRSRIVTIGENVRIQKLAISKPYFDKEEGWVMVLLNGPSFPSNLVMDKINLTVWVTDLSNNKNVFRQTKTIEKIKTDELVGKVFSFTSTPNLANFKICAKVDSAKESYDTYCYDVNSANFQAGKEIIPEEPSEDKTIISILAGVFITAGVIIFVIRRMRR